MPQELFPFVFLAPRGLNGVVDVITLQKIYSFSTLPDIKIAHLYI